MAAGVLRLGEDGSTWRAFVAPDKGHRVRRSAFYAAVGRSAEPRRTRSPRPGATLGSRGLLETSALVSRGSDDAWGYDSTSTNPKVIDLSQPDMGYHYYRRIANDDPPLTAGRRVEISFRQPLMPDDVDTDHLSYVVAIPGEMEPIVIEHFPYNAHRGQAVINEPIVEDIVEKLQFNQRYDLEAYSKIGNELLNPPDGTEKFEFTIIVDSLPPELE